MSKTAPHSIAGHKKPDTDSVVAAEVLAWLYGEISDAPDNAIPVRLGPLNRQTQWLFEQAGRKLGQTHGHRDRRTRSSVGWHCSKSACGSHPDWGI